MLAKIYRARTNMIDYAYLETTNYCNLDCSFCNRKEVIGKLQHMPVEKFAELLSKIKHYPIKEAKLMGMGEPFMHPEFHIICRMFKETFPDAFLIVATNAQYRIKESFSESLKYIDQLYLSIDGYKESYERDRAPAKWSKLIAFLDELSTINKHDCDVVVNYVVNPNNVYDIPHIEKLAADYKLGELRLNIAQDWTEDNNMPDDYSEEHIDYLRSNYKHNIKGVTPWTYSDCFWVKRGLYTTVEGHVKVCCLNTAAKPLGNIFEQSIETIHNNIEFQAIKKGCAENKPTNHCATCSYRTLSPLLGRLTK